VDDFDGNTFRAVYTVRFAGVIYVLHAFQKKSKSGIATPRHEIALIEQRLKRARDLLLLGNHSLSNAVDRHIARRPLLQTFG
jgi:phage-related protein